MRSPSSVPTAFASIKEGARLPFWRNAVKGLCISVRLQRFDRRQRTGDFGGNDDSAASFADEPDPLSKAAVLLAHFPSFLACQDRADPWLVNHQTPHPPLLIAHERSKRVERQSRMALIGSFLGIVLTRRTLN